MRERLKKMCLGIIIILGLIGIDQITKFIARKYLLPKGSVTIIKNFFDFTYVENRGGAWGSLSGKYWFFIAITIVALGVLTYLFKDFDLTSNKVYSIGLCFLVAGTLGNFIDRIIFKYVTDFLDFNFFGYDFPVFNVADICLTCGVILMIIKVLFLSKAE